MNLKNWKTTVAGIVVALVIILKIVKIEVPEDVSNGLIAIAVFVGGYFAKDKDVTGTN